MSEVDTASEILSADVSSTASPPSVPPVAGPPAVARRGRDGFIRWVWISLGVVVGLLIASAFVPAQWLGRVLPGHSLVDDGAVALKPGSAQGTGSRVTISDLAIFEPDGQILFTTVAIDDQVTVLEWIESSFDDDIVLRSREDVFGTRTASEQRERNLQLMRVSKDTAVVAALEHLGVEAVIESGIGFNSVVEGGPVDGLVEVGEIIIGLDGQPVGGFESLRAILDEVAPGETGQLTLEDLDSGVVRQQQFIYGVHPEGVEGGFIGISDVTVRAEDADLPYDVAIDSGSIGGPSAGLAFTLTLLDLLTEGELTGGKRIAVTGTISQEGLVGNVGGVGQKAAAASERGVDAFIVPIDLVDAAEAHAGDMPVIGAATLEDALAALASQGGQTEGLQLP